MKGRAVQSVRTSLRPNHPRVGRSCVHGRGIVRPSRARERGSQTDPIAHAGEGSTDQHEPQAQRVRPVPHVATVACDRRVPIERAPGGTAVRPEPGYVQSARSTPTTQTVRLARSERTTRARVPSASPADHGAAPRRSVSCALLLCCVRKSGAAERQHERPCGGTVRTRRSGRLAGCGSGRSVRTFERALQELQHVHPERTWTQPRTGAGGPLGPPALPPGCTRIP
jgi:hypothetical protein